MCFKLSLDLFLILNPSLIEHGLLFDLIDFDFDDGNGNNKDDEEDDDDDNNDDNGGGNDVDK